MQTFGVSASQALLEAAAGESQELGKVYSYSF
jgi:hypothetical protein